MAKKKKKEINFIITDYDKNGNVIEDLSKVVVPIEMQLELLKELNDLRRQEAEKLQESLSEE